MLDSQNKNLKNVIAFIILSFCTVFSLIPSFTLTGHFFLQNAATALIVLAIFLAAVLLEIEPPIVAKAVCVSIGFWISFAVVWQIVAHFLLNDTSVSWHYLFFYDKIMTLYMLWISVNAYYTIRLMISKDLKHHKENYKSFYKIMFKVFIVLYALTFLYCFIICRTPSEEALPINFKPFLAFENTFLSNELNYELLIYFFGNIMIFLPLGTMVSHHTKNIPLLIILPVILSCAIEVLQYLFRMGYADIDDVILNTIGFYLGILLNFILSRISKKYAL